MRTRAPTARHPRRRPCRSSRRARPSTRARRRRGAARRRRAVGARPTTRVPAGDRRGRVGVARRRRRRAGPAAVAAGVPYASVADRDADPRRAARARRRRRARAARASSLGCGLAPGLADVLARHAAGALDSVDEVHVARWGVAGRRVRERAPRARTGSRRSSGVTARSCTSEHRHAELIWFPDPVGARECELVATGVELLVAANPGVGRVTVAPRRAARSGGSRRRGRRDPGAAVGAVRVEVWGARARRGAVVYGVIERTAVAAGTVLGVAGAGCAGALPRSGPEPQPGAVRPRHGGRAGAVPRRTPRGVKAAAFEGSRSAEAICRQRPAQLVPPPPPCARPRSAAPGTRSYAARDVNVLRGAASTSSPGPAGRGNGEAAPPNPVKDTGELPNSDAGQRAASRGIVPREAGGTLHETTPEAGLFRRISSAAIAAAALLIAYGCGASSATAACAAARTVRGRCTQPTASWTRTAFARSSYHGVEFDVPAGWPVYDLAADPTTCVRFDRHAVYSVTRAPTCPARRR